MRIYSHLSAYPSQARPVVLTIGNFDGVHLGHQKVIKKTIQMAKQLKGQSVVITFRNHPIEVLSPEKPLELLCTPQHKEKLFAELGVDIVFFLLFTKQFALQDPETFLKKVKKTVNYRQIFLGYDAKIGSERKGDQKLLLHLAEKYDYTVSYLDPYLVGGVPVSSSRIRQAVKCGDFLEAKSLLGRPFSIFSSVVEQTSDEKFSEIAIFCDKLCLPREGSYEVLVRHGEQTIAKGVAFCKQQQFSVHLPKNVPNLMGQKVDISFEQSRKIL